MKRLALSALVGIFGLIGLFRAAGASNDSGYALGLLLFVVSVGVIFWMIKQHFDGVRESRMLDLWPERPQNGWLLLAVLGVVGLAGLFVASGGDVSLYWSGLALFVTACIMALITMKRIFDGPTKAARDRNGAHAP